MIQLKNKNLLFLSGKCAYFINIITSKLPNNTIWLLNKNLETPIGLHATPNSHTHVSHHHDKVLYLLYCSSWTPFRKSY